MKRPARPPYDDEDRSAVRPPTPCPFPIGRAGETCKRCGYPWLEHVPHYAATRKAVSHN